MKHKLTGIWTDLKTRAAKAAREGKKRAAQEDGHEVQTLKHARVDCARSLSPARSIFTLFRRSADVGGANNSRPDVPGGDNGVEAMKIDVMRYQAY